MRAYDRAAVRRGVVASVLGVGVAGSQAGHLVAYALRFGPTAQRLQSSGAHAYFPSAAKTILGVAAMVAVAALLIVALARIIGSRARPESAPSYLRILAILFTIQLAAFAAQETMESLLSGSATSVPLVLVWGTAGQLPVALVAAVALRWLLARIGPAAAQLVLQLEPAFQLAINSIALVVFPVAAELPFALEVAPAAYNRRGPPSF